MNNEKLHKIIADALEQAEDGYRNDYCEYNEIPDRACEIVRGRIRETEYDLTMHIYWYEDIFDDRDTLSENMDYMLKECLNKKIVCYAVNTSDFDEGYMVVSFLTTKGE